jgi:hypothetical protein
MSQAQPQRLVEGNKQIQHRHKNAVGGDPYFKDRTTLRGDGGCIEDWG